MNKPKASTPKQVASLTNILTFLIPSLLGILLFITPIRYESGITIPVAILAKTLKVALGENIASIVTLIVTFTGLMTIINKLFEPKYIENRPFLSGLLNLPPLWILVRISGMLFILMSYFQVGPEALWSNSTGGMVLHELLPTLFAVFIFAGVLLPLLMNFGLLELLGALMTRIMRPMFNLPGRSAINCIASWLGDGSVGILMTSKQYESAYYTQREAAIIGTTFSAVSITFSLVVIAQVGLEHMFAQFYLTVCVTGFVAAVIVPRLPPLSRKKDVLITGLPPEPHAEVIPAGRSVLSWGIEKALEKAATTKSVLAVLEDGIKNAIDLVFGVIPVIMCIGTIALMTSEYTPIFEYLGIPFIPILNLLQIPEAELAANTIVIGFADMFVPSILAASIESEITRFVVAALSLTQLIYLSEVGALLLGSKIPVTLWELFAIFILRTLVTLPVISLMAHWFF
ncbi:hypothetical protein ACH42_14430 [Endozoicomonas sp. (ex Bugula neritina AB1)]|nr:hypothetical protein ACH42_14430 [Endozoicomonas sp. (ex Bugula neritina AB1)]